MGNIRSSFASSPKREARTFIPWEERIFFRKGEFLLSREFPFFISKVDQGYTSFHHHEFLEMVYVWRGTAVHHINRKRIPVEAGDIFFISMHDHHGYEHVDNLQLVNILFAPSLLGSGFFRQSVGRKKTDYPLFGFAFLSPLMQSSMWHLHLVGMSALRVRELIETMAAEFQKKPGGYRERIERDMVDFLIIVSREYALQKVQSLDVREQIGYYRRKFEQALDFMKQNYSSEISLGKVASIACFNPNYFSELFHKFAGTTFSRYLNTLRIQEAARLLATTELKIEAVARRCGFNTYQHFKRVFRNTFQTSPSEYRKKVLPS
ncbi:MAG: helix-turn-helix domain-containing protein [Candidatus Omnitrophota bacterium]